MALTTSASSVKIDRLPICDSLFCIISLILLVAEGVTLIFTLFYTYSNSATEEISIIYFALLISFFILGSLTVSVTSIVWYLKINNRHGESHDTSVDLGLHVCLHFFQLSLIWRYVALLKRVRWNVAKLLICELCSLRALHSLLISLPFCSVLLYFIFKHWFQVPILISVTCALCYMDLCWSLASYGRKCRRDNANYLVLCWPSVLSQFLWRLGTVGSRLTALVLYASLHGYYVALVVFLHFLVTCLGLVLVVPPSPTRGTDRSFGVLASRLVQAARLGSFYVVFFYNPSDYRTRRRFAAFYCVMFLENSLLTSVWLVSSLSLDGRWTSMHTFVSVFVWFGFAYGIMFMLIYYRYFHVTKLKAKHQPIANRAAMTSSPPGRPVVFACSAQLPFKKQPSRFRPPPLTSSASSTCVPRSSAQQQVTVELVEQQRRSKSVPAIDRKNDPRSQSRDLDYSAPGVYSRGEKVANVNSYPKRHSSSNNRSELLDTVDVSSDAQIGCSKISTNSSALRSSIDSNGAATKERIETVF